MLALLAKQTAKQACLILNLVLAQAAVASLVPAQEIIANSSIKKFMLAVQQGKHVEVLKTLKHIAINSRDELARTAVHYAVIHDQADILNTLVRRGADLNLVDAEGKTAYDHHLLMTTVNETGSILEREGGRTADDIAKEFAAEDMKRNNATLFQAAANGNRTLVEDLLEIGVNPKIKNEAGLFPFHIAVQNKQPAIAAILLKAMRGKDGTDDKSWTPMHWAVLARDWDMLRELLRAKAKFRYRFIYTATREQPRSYQDPYDIAKRSNRLEQFISIVQEEGRNDIMLQLVEKATSSDDYQVLLKELNGFGINLQTDSKAAERAIDTVVRHKKTNIARYLLAAGLHEDAYIGRGLLHHRSVLHEAEMISLLLEHGVNPDEASLHGVRSSLTTLYTIARKYRPDSAKVLLEHGANPNGDGVHIPPLLVIIEEGKKYYRRDGFEDLEELLEYGANPNSKDMSGRSALHELLRGYKPDDNINRKMRVKKIAALLLQYGANPDLQDADGVSARQYLQERIDSSSSEDNLKAWQEILQLINTHSSP